MRLCHNWQDSKGLYVAVHICISSSGLESLSPSASQSYRGSLILILILCSTIVTLAQQAFQLQTSAFMIGSFRNLGAEGKGHSQNVNFQQLRNSGDYQVRAMETKESPGNLEDFIPEVERTTNTPSGEPRESNASPSETLPTSRLIRNFQLVESSNSDNSEKCLLPHSIAQKATKDLESPPYAGLHYPNRLAMRDENTSLDGNWPSSTRFRAEMGTGTEPNGHHARHQAMQELKDSEVSDISYRFYDRNLRQIAHRSLTSPRPCSPNQDERDWRFIPKQCSPQEAQNGLAPPCYTNQQRKPRTPTSGVSGNERIPGFLTEFPGKPQGPVTRVEKPYYYTGVPPIVTVSGRHRCNHCCLELGNGAAMIIESLGLLYHQACFCCTVCGILLGSGKNSANVRVRGTQLHCGKCFSIEGYALVSSYSSQI